MALVLLAPASARADDAALLERHRPVSVLDAQDRHPVAGVRGEPPASYGRAAPAKGGGRWLQYWRWHTDNPQARGIVRTGRHQGDWELVQVRLGVGPHARRCARGLPGQRVARRLLPPWRA